MSESRGRCGAAFNYRVCGTEDDPVWAIYCNESNGWCGKTDLHRSGPELVNITNFLILK